MKVTFIAIVIGAVTKGLIKGLTDGEISGDHPNYCVIEIDQNTEKSPRDLRRFAVPQTLV